MAGKFKKVATSEGYTLYRARNWAELTALVNKAGRKLSPEKREGLWFRGTSDKDHQLSPTLMRETGDLSEDHHNQIEQDLFFEFQAKSPNLRSGNLTEWEYLFYSRHHGVPTRLIDWTDTLGVALYFALEPRVDAAAVATSTPAAEPAIWMFNPYSLNEETWDFRDIVLPRYLGLVDGYEDYWDFGELLAGSGKWAWDGPVAIYPIQLAERVRAQRGWFTIHGNNRDPLEAQYPGLLWKIVLEEKCIKQCLEFLEWAGFNKFSIYPDFDNLAVWLKQKNLSHLPKQAISKNASAPLPNAKPRLAKAKRRSEEEEEEEKKQEEE